MDRAAAGGPLQRRPHGRRHRHGQGPAIGGGIGAEPAPATHHQAAVRPTAIIRPGTMAARNSLVIDRPAVTPNRIRPLDGGTIGPMTLPAAIRPALCFGLWPALSIIGKSSADMAAASAAADPESEARMHEAMMQT